MAGSDAGDLACELDDIQSGALQERPSPYVGTYLLLRIDDRAAGRELVRRLHRLAQAQHGAANPDQETSVTVAFTYHGLAALGVPQSSLDSFAPEFRARHGGPCRRARRRRTQRPGALGEAVGNVRGARGGGGALAGRRPAPGGRGEGAARPRGAARRRAHLAAGLLPATDRTDVLRLQGRDRAAQRRGQRARALQPAANGPSRPARSSSATRTRRASCHRCPLRDELGRNGTYVVFRKLHTRVAAYRQFLRDRASSRAEEELLGAKMVGRWQSGAPLGAHTERRRPGARSRSEAQQRLPLRR